MNLKDLELDKNIKSIILDEIDFYENEKVEILIYLAKYIGIIEDIDKYYLLLGGRELITKLSFDNSDYMIENARKILKTLNQKKVEELSKESHLILLCGHYEGIDQRVIDKIVDEEISIGDYVLTGGEIPAMVLIDSVSRYIEGVLSKDSTKEESFSNGMLEYPQYTRPEVFENEKVPEILLTGHHENIEKWRRKRAIEITYKKRPDLLKNKNLSEMDVKLLSEVQNKCTAHE